MPLTTDEILQRRLSDPYFGLAEELAAPSLAATKKMSLAAAHVEKKRAIDPAQASADEAFNVDNYLEGGPQGVGLSDIAESSLYRGRENLFDFISGRTQDPGAVQALADVEAGVTPEDRKRLVSDPQEKVIQSLAKGGRGYLEAIPQALAAGPATLADSAQVVPELIGGALATAFGGSGAAVLARRGEKLFSGGKKLLKRVETAKEALEKAKKSSLVTRMVKGTPKAAGQVSVATADITQGQINEFTQEHGVEPTRAQAAQMYALNLATMIVEPGIIKNLFVPKFKEQISKEIVTLGQNLGSGSNFKSIALRVIDGTKKVTAAAGAEAGQEYFQTWAESLNVGLGPEQRKTFFESAAAIVGDKDKQLEAMVGAYLGAGAGATARLAVAAPQLAAGAALDTTKGTAKVAAKTVGKAVKVAGRAVSAVANKGAYKVLSQEERDTIRSEHGSRKVLVDTKVSEFETAIGAIQKSKSLSDIGKTGSIYKVIQARLESSGIKEADLADKKTYNSFKNQLIRTYRADIALLKTELATSTAAAVAKRSGKNIVSKSVEAAKEAVDAVSPSVEAVVAKVKDLGPEVVQAVEELRSSTALGMIEMAGTAGKAEVKTIVTAAHSLSLDDLKRTANVIGKLKPEIGKRLVPVIRAKEKALERSGLKINEIINDETLSPIIRDVAKRAQVAATEVAAVSSAINRTVASTISDMAALKDTEAALAALEKTDAYKNQVKGAMTKKNVEVVKRRLAKVRLRLEGEAVTLKDKAVQGVKDAAAVAGAVAGSAVKAAKKKVGEVTDDIETSGKQRARSTPLKITSRFKKVMESVVQTLNRPNQTEELLKSVSGLVKEMRKVGIENRAAFEVFVEAFPELQTNIEFYKALEAEYPTNVVFDELFDNVKTIAVGTFTKMKEAYNKMTPPECKV